MNMNIQNLMREAKKMQDGLEKTKKELENTNYEGTSSIVKVVLNGNKDVQAIDIDENFEISSKDDIEMLEDMILTAYKDAAKKVDNDKKSKLSKYGSGLTGLM